MILAVLAGEPGPARDIVLLNAGAAIYVAGMAGSLQSGVAKAAQVIDDRSAREKLKQLIELSAQP
jgi:anthranilate phosphoribosyltransferase